MTAVSGVKPLRSAICLGFLEKSLRKITSEPGSIPSVKSTPGVPAEMILRLIITKQLAIICVVLIIFSFKVVYGRNAE